MGSKKAWYLMTSEKEKNRRNLMKADEIQRSLPRRLKEYEVNTDRLREKAENRKQSLDPMELMHRLMKEDAKQKNINHHTNEDMHESFKKKLKKQRKKERKKSKRSRKKHKKYDDESDDDGHASKRKRVKHRKHKSSKKKR